MPEIQVTVKYFALYRDIAGVESELWVLPARTKVDQLLRMVGKKHGPPMYNQLYDPNGVAWDTLILALNKDAIFLPDSDCELHDGDLLHILFPVVGG